MSGDPVVTAARSQAEAWRRLLAAAGLAASLAVLVSVGSVSAESAEEYFVQPGDTLWSIATRHDVSIWELIEYNEITNANLIRIGERLLIPRGEAPALVADAAPMPEAPVVEVLVAPPPDPTEWLPDQFRINQYCLQGRMSNGAWVHEGAVAAPAGLFPLGTVVEIDGLGVYTVSDRMGWSSAQMLDVWTPNCRDAIIWGTRFQSVRIISH